MMKLMNTRRLIATTMAVVQASLWQRPENADARTCILDGGVEIRLPPPGLDAYATTAGAMSLHLGDLVDIFVFARSLVHNRLVALRVAAAKREPGFAVNSQELEAMFFVADELDGVPGLLDRTDPAIAARSIEPVPAFVPACLQFRLAEIDESARQLICRLDAEKESSKRRAKEFSRRKEVWVRQRANRTDRNYRQIGHACEAGLMRSRVVLAGDANRPRQREKHDDPAMLI